jgi:transposase InsO family protein
MIARGTTHLSADQLAKLGLDGLPKTKRGIHMRAEAEGWSAVRRSGRGGGLLYALADLPASAQIDIAGRLSGDNRRRRGRPKDTDFWTRHPEVADAVEAILAEQRIAAPRVLELLEMRFDELPSLRSLQRRCAMVERTKPALLASMRDPDAYKSRFRLALGRADGGVDRAHQVWELDTTKADVMTRGGRRMVLGVIDRWSRRARFLVAPSESGQSVRRLLIDTIRAWGVMPEAVATDNGAGYINASIRTALDTLGIEHRICPPGSPEKKPFVERLFGTFTRERAQLLAGFAGHSVAEAQRLRAVAKKQTGRAVIVAELEPDDLQAILDAWVDGVYHQREHSALRMTPMQKWLSSPLPATAAPSEDVLRVALSALVGTHKVGKRGIQWKAGRYWTAELTPYIGRQVVVRRDEDDLGALFAFDEDGHYIGTAVNAERAGFSEADFAAEAKRQQAEWTRQARAQVRERQRGFGIDEAKQLLLRRDAERAGKLHALPLPTEQRDTAAMRSIVARPMADLPAPARIAAAWTQSEQPARAETVAERVARTDAIIAAAERGDAVDADDLRRARLFTASSQYRAEKLITGDFTPTPIQARRAAS